MARRVHTELREHIYSTWRFLNPRVWSNGKTLAIMSRDPWFDSGCVHFCLLFCSVCVFCQCCSTILCCFWDSGSLLCSLSEIYWFIDENGLLHRWGPATGKLIRHFVIEAVKKNLGMWELDIAYFRFPGELKFVYVEELWTVALSKWKQSLEDHRSKSHSKNASSEQGFFCRKSK